MSEQLLLPRPDPCLVRIAHGFGGGIAGTQDHLCGALSGGIILLGYLYGREDHHGSDEPLYNYVERYRQRFLVEIGGPICRDLRTEGPYGHDGPLSCTILMTQAAALLWDCLPPRAHE